MGAPVPIVYGPTHRRRAPEQVKAWQLSDAGNAPEWVRCAHDDELFKLEVNFSGQGVTFHVNRWDEILRFGDWLIQREDGSLAGVLKEDFARDYEPLS